MVVSLIWNWHSNIQSALWVIKNNTWNYPEFISCSKVKLFAKRVFIISSMNLLSNFCFQLNNLKFSASWKKKCKSSFLYVVFFCVSCWLVDIIMCRKISDQINQSKISIAQISLSNTMERCCLFHVYIENVYTVSVCHWK